MWACWASRIRVHSRLAAVAALCLVAASAGPNAAEARRRTADTTTVRSGDIDVRSVQVQRSSDGKRMHLKGDLDVNGRHIDFDDTVDVAIPRFHRIHGGADVPGIHIESDDESIVRMGSDIVIDSTEVVEDAVVALFGNVTVRGHVGDVVAVLGSIRLERGAIVDGDAVAVGGSLDQDPDALVHGQSISLSFLPMRSDVPPLRALSLALLASWVLAMLMGGLLALLFPKRVTGIARAVSERTGWSLLLGLTLPPIAVITAVLLIVTLIGIPIACLLPLVYLFTLWAGAVASTYLLGCRATRRELGSGAGLPLLVGTVVVGVLFALGALFSGTRSAIGGLGLFFPLLGILLVTSLSVIGSGAVLVSRFGSVPREPAPGSVPYAGVTPAPPPPGAATAPPAAI